MVLGTDIAKGENFSANTAVTSDSDSLLEDQRTWGVQSGRLVCMHCSLGDKNVY